MASKNQGLGTFKGNLEATVNLHHGIIIGVVVVVVVGFATMLITAGALINDSLAEKKATSQDIRDQVKTQNDKIQVLTTEITNLTKALQNEQKTIQKTN